MSVDWYAISCALLLGGGIGLLTGFFGAGGGFILTPALNVFLGLDMTLAVGTSAFQVCGASAFTLCQRVDRRWMGARVALAAAVGIFPGTWLGTRLVVWLRGQGDWHISGRSVAAADTALLLLFVLLLTGIGVGMYGELRSGRPEKPDRAGLLHPCRIPPLATFRTVPAGPFSVPVLALLGFGMGILSGLLGICGGVIMLPVLFYLVGQQTEYATLTTTMIVLISGLGSTFFHSMNGNLAWGLLPPLLAGSLCGTCAGVRLQKRTGGRKLRKYFIWVVAAALLLVIWKLFRLFN
ncbi:MAG: sulfite exporter TauE/SafE family protein [Lentisphaeria bacterium]|nr:sulfite exporter TauE/SafE family protein [Lentisphaeria bacterium]